MEPAIPVELRPFARLDPRRVRRGLSRAARIEPDDLLATIHQHLMERVEEIRLEPTRILELGRTPGPLARQLQQRHPKARVVSMGIAPPVDPLVSGIRLPWKHHPAALIGDPVRLPLPSDHFDLVVSNMMLHWSSDPMATLKELRRVLKPDAPLLLVTMGHATFGELRPILARIDQERHGRTWIRVPEFPSLHDLGEQLAGAGLALPVVDRDLWCPRFADAHALLAELRRMGATNPHRQRPTTLMGPGYLRQLAADYRAQHGDEHGAIPVTLEILFGHAWKKNRTVPTSPLSPPVRQ
ncbi:MAG: methyltransferase domain-containing protein [Magnetococcales bacterium]|nr:methyltransferase domain-containing protein [Magnetococcales bacterium]